MRDFEILWSMVVFPDMCMAQNQSFDDSGRTTRTAGRGTLGHEVSK